MRLPNLHISKTVCEIVKIITSRKGLKQFLTTPLYTNAFYLMLNTAVMSFLGFFFWVVVARLYAEKEVGFSSAIITTINLLTVLGLLGLNFSLIRFLPQAEKPQQLINTCFTLTGLTTLVLAGIFLAGINLWSPALAFIRQNAIFSSAFIIFALFWALARMLDSAFIARRRAGFVLLKNTIYSLLKIPLPIFFILFFHSFGVVASWGIASSIAVATSLFLFLPKVQNRYKPVPTLKLTLIKDTWRYSGGNYVADLLSAASVWLLPLMVVNLLGAESNAYFYIAWMTASLLFAIPSAISQSLFAEGSHFEDKLKENVTKSLKFTFLLLVPAVVLLVVAGKWLLLAFGPSYSANALPLLQILAVSSLPLAINYIYFTILRVTGRIKELIIIWSFIATAVLSASYLVMPATGIIGIGYAWLGAQVVTAIYVASAIKLAFSK